MSSLARAAGGGDDEALVFRCSGTWRASPLGGGASASHQRRGGEEPVGARVGAFVRRWARGTWGVTREDAAMMLAMTAAALTRISAGELPK